MCVGGFALHSDIECHIFQFETKTTAVTHIAVKFCRQTSLGQHHALVGSVPLCAEVVGESTMNPNWQ